MSHVIIKSVTLCIESLIKFYNSLNHDQINFGNQINCTLYKNSINILQKEKSKTIKFITLINSNKLKNHTIPANDDFITYAA